MHLDRKMMGVLAAAVLLACGGGGGSNDTPPPPPPPPANAILINAGGADIADTDWKADAYFAETGSATYENTNEMDLSKLSDPKPPAAIFNSERYGQPDITYTITGLTAAGAYTVTLYNEESFLSAEGARVFSVEINGTAVLTDYDLFLDAGAQNTAVEKVFDAQATEAGEIVIHFTPGVENPKICGIKVAPKA